MRVISKSRLRQFIDKHANAKQSLNSWYKAALKARWTDLLDVQSQFPSAEAVGNFTVFNIRGNRYRLIVDIQYTRQIIFIKYVFTHAEYDKNDWKNDRYF
ncbi:type II toxin-antitoxin system HigB family toxin [Synechococcus sp. PCC 7336]|uniref:type II toxin-antitoxin system HigB family toxin n=1 Tax=Synechococcus sp. PCC 7336 TaxID=195250 RepID=UPI0003716920|nr:type II toxin-antitoxin system HigB family toxin [Synechococcus sp. PCC 7336]